MALELFSVWELRRINNLIVSHDNSYWTVPQWTHYEKVNGSGNVNIWTDLEICLTFTGSWLAEMTEIYSSALKFFLDTQGRNLRGFCASFRSQSWSSGWTCRGGEEQSFFNIYSVGDLFSPFIRDWNSSCLRTRFMAATTLRLNDVVRNSFVCSIPKLWWKSIHKYKYEGIFFFSYT